MSDIICLPFSVTRKAYIGRGNNALHSAENQIGRGKIRSLVSKFSVCVWCVCVCGVCVCVCVCVCASQQNLHHLKPSKSDAKCNNRNQLKSQTFNELSVSRQSQLAVARYDVSTAMYRKRHHQATLCQG